MTHPTTPEDIGARFRVVTNPYGRKRGVLIQEIQDCRTIEVIVPDDKLDQVIGDLISIRQSIPPHHLPRS